jgi:hypothetical protein
MTMIEFNIEIVSEWLCCFGAFLLFIKISTENTRCTLFYLFFTKNYIILLFDFSKTSRICLVGRSDGALFFAVSGRIGLEWALFFCLLFA